MPVGGLKNFYKVSTDIRKNITSFKHSVPNVPKMTQCHPVSKPVPI